MTDRPAACRAALYLRLSRDDPNSSESESISNQRRLLTEYARLHHYPIVAEFADDGCSGTNFNRPQFRAMMDAVDAGFINLILVKDLSRLGRDYIQTGRYLELVFPEKGVRFIAVNDGVDTLSADADLTPFRNMVNEMYARDTSRKIRSALQAKMRAGQFVGSFAPYGYQKDPADKNHLVPDGRAAGIVREIFTRAASGERPADIARLLNQRGELPPALYRCATQPQLDPEQYSRRREWTSTGVSRILKDVVYLGHVAQGKTDKVSFKSHKIREKHPDDWIIVRDCHTPLVSQQTFSQVQRQRASRRIPRKGTFSNLFSGLAFCADCGKSMSAAGTRKKGSTANLVCGAYKLHGTSACSNHTIDYDMLYQCVLTAVRAYVTLTPAECDGLFQRLCVRLGLDHPHPDSAGQTGYQAGYQAGQWKKELRQLGALVGRLYEDRALGKISDIHFYPLLEQYEQKTKALQWKIQQDDHMNHPVPLQVRQRQLRRLIVRYADLQELSAPLLFELIERIEIEQGHYAQGRKCKRQRVRIRFRFLSEPYETELIRS